MTRKIHRSLTLLVLTVAAFTYSPLRAAEPAVLLFDQAHGAGEPRPPLADIAQKQNFTVKTTATALSPESLRGARLLFICTPSQAFAPAEKEAVIGFVKAGGALLVALDEEKRQPLKVTGLNDIIAPFGMKLTGDTEYLHNRGALAKAGEIHAAARELPYSGGRAVEGGTPFAHMLDRKGQPAQPYAAWHRLDNGGRVIVIAEAMAPLFYGSQNGTRLTGTTPADTQYWGKDSVVFMEEVIAWLMK